MCPHELPVRRGYAIPVSTVSIRANPGWSRNTAARLVITTEVRLDRHMRVVTVEVRELVRLVVDQNEDLIFGAKKRTEAIAEGHDFILCV